MPKCIRQFPFFFSDSSRWWICMNLLLCILFKLALVDAGYYHLVAGIGLNTMLWLSFKMFPADMTVKRLLLFYCENKTTRTVSQKFEGFLFSPKTVKITSECHNQWDMELLSLTFSIFLVTQTFSMFCCAVGHHWHEVGEGVVGTLNLGWW